MSAHAQKRYRALQTYTCIYHSERLVCNHEPRAKALGNYCEWSRIIVQYLRVHVMYVSLYSFITPNLNIHVTHQYTNYITPKPPATCPCSSIQLPRAHIQNMCIQCTCSLSPTVCQQMRTNPHIYWTKSLSSSTQKYGLNTAAKWADNHTCHRHDINPQTPVLSGLDRHVTTWLRDRAIKWAC